MGRMSFSLIKSKNHFQKRLKIWYIRNKVIFGEREPYRGIRTERRQVPLFFKVEKDSFKSRQELLRIGKKGKVKSKNCGDASRRLIKRSASRYTHHKKAPISKRSHSAYPCTNRGSRPHSVAPPCQRGTVARRHRRCRGNRHPDPPGREALFQRSDHWPPDCLSAR